MAGSSTRETARGRWGATRHRARHRAGPRRGLLVAGVLVLAVAVVLLTQPNLVTGY